MNDIKCHVITRFQIEFKYFSLIVCSIQLVNWLMSVNMCGKKLSFVDHVKIPRRTVGCSGIVERHVNADPLKF